ncbi:vacuolar membrane-associated protein IML1 [Scheffersomyces xylosifermentans]|uniref:vacuolar membrane-associated protein IML1 n=1 Tax=Scheffersomyces xylosifermentans TaxID=1304137 RepID=UPI00315C9088
MQHARGYNTLSSTKLNHSTSANTTIPLGQEPHSSVPLSKSSSTSRLNATNTSSGQPMNSNMMSLQIGGSRVTSAPSNTPHFINRNVGSTITVGKRHNSLDHKNQHQSSQMSNLSRSTIKTSDSIGTLIRESSPATILDQKEPIQLTVWFHDLRTSDEDVIIDSKALPGGVRNGQVYELQSLESEDSRKLLFVVTEKNLRENNSNQEELHNDGSQLESSASNQTQTPIAKSKFQISLISNPLQKLLDIPPRSLVQIKRVTDLNLVEADSVEIFVKDVSLSRDSMWSFSSTLVNTCVHIDKRLLFLHNRTGTVRYIYKNGRNIFSGFIGENTKVTFRSESAKLTVLIQLSREMWHFEENGEIMFHKLVNNLFPKIFKRWRDKNTHHAITIVLFTSMDLTDIPWTTLEHGERPNNRRDYFRVVVDQVNIFHWDKIMANLRLEFANFKRDIMLNAKEGDQNTNYYAMEGEPLPSVKGNILEAVNLGMTMVNNRFINTDLKHSLYHYIVVTPGTGIFDVDYELMLQTSKKITSIDTGLDIICLSQPPLHVVPLFRYLKDGQVFHVVPNWCDISFYKDSSSVSNQWIPRCKIYELQMMGVMENKVNDIRIERFQKTQNAKTLLEAMENYDNDLFKPVNHKNSIKSVEEDALNMYDLDRKSRNSSGSFKPSTLKNANATLSLIFNKRTQLLPTEIAPSQSSVLGTVSHSSSEMSALSSLYSLNKVTDDRPSQFGSSALVNATSLRSMRSLDALRGQTPSPRLIKGESIFKKESKMNHKDLTSDSINGTKVQDKRKGRHSTDISTSNNSHKNTRRKKALDHDFNKRRSHSKGSGNIESTEPEKPTDLFWTEIANPSQELDTDRLLFPYLSRWSNAFPDKIKRRSVKWRSFQSPAALPITTGVFPSTKQLETEYTFQIYNVLLNYENYLELETTHQLMRELILLRLLLGFQICFGDQVKRVESERKPGGNVESLIKYFPEHNFLGARIYMSLDDEIHRIFLDYNGNLNVQLYRKTATSEENKITLGQTHKLKSYFPLIRTRYADEYSPAKLDGINSTPQKYNWNQFDQLVAGYDDAMPDTNKEFHKMKFVVMPAPIPKNAFYITNESLTDEEIRLEGLRKLIAMIEKGKYTKRSSKVVKKKEEILPEIIFYTDNLYDFLNEEAENYDITGDQPSLMVPESSRFNKTIKLSELAEELQSPTGLTLVDRTWHFKRHLHCFLGSELVSWLLESFEDIETRDEATSYGQSLMNKGLFKHVESRHGLLDGYYFYEFEDEYVDKAYIESKTSWFGKKKTPSDKPAGTVTTPAYTRNNSDVESLTSPNFPSSEAFDLKKVISATLASESGASSVDGSTNGRKKKKFILSRAIKYNVDPLNKSFRPELITVHYDRVHNPEHCYHIRLQWLSTTTKFIDETISGWSRLCERHGLKLVETPWKELCTIPQINPFHSFVEIKLKVNPLIDEEFVDLRILRTNKFYYHLYFLKKADFLLDNRSSIFFSRDNIEISYSWGKPTFQYAQYIHKSGTYIIELRDNGDFFLAPNNIHITRVNTTLTAIPDFDTGIKTYNLDSQKVMLNFRSACQNTEYLRELFREAKSNWREEYSIEMMPTTS